jgi:beta-lactam-binding protein with PASTA domain
LLFLGPIPNSLAGPPGDPAPKAPVARTTSPKVVDVGPDVSAAYGTGTVVHADALRAGEHALVDLDVAFSGAAFSSAPSPSDYVNEVHRLVAPKLDPKKAFSRGTGLELGLGSDPIPLIGQLSQTDAPPSTGLIHRVVGPIGIPSVLQAELLRSASRSRALDDACVLGPPQSYGLGSVLNLEVLGGLLSTVARPPLREVSQSSSTTRIVPGSEPGRLGLQSETRQTIAPVTFFSGTPFQFTVEVLGEWALQAVADGANGTIHYGPLVPSPETPIARILDAKGKVLGQLTTQMLLGRKGLDVTIPGVAEIVIGEDPRMIGGDASSNPVEDPTQAVAAVDVVRVKLLSGQLADVRIGHMEAAVSVPSGGVACPGLTVDQTVDKPTVTPGGDFVYVIDMTNPNDCVLDKVTFVEKLTLPPGAKVEVVGTTPPGGQAASGVIDASLDSLAAYPDIGPLGPAEKKTVKITLKVPLDSAAGLLKALGVAQAVCPPEMPAATDVAGPDMTPSTGTIPVRGEDSVDGPTIGVCVVPDLKNLPLTQAVDAIVKAGCILGQVKEGPIGNPADKGKVIDQSPSARTTVPLGTPVDVTIAGPVCSIPSVAGLTPEQAKPILIAAGCDLGTVTVGPAGNPDDAGKITGQNPPAGGQVPEGTKVDVVIAPPVGAALLGAAATNCTVPAVIGMSESDARSKVEASGCVLVTEPVNTTNPAEIGKVTTQTPAAAMVVPRGSAVKVTIGTQVLGATLNRQPAETAAAPLVRTGGVALGAWALWLLFGGLATRLAGSERVWRLARRRIG